MGINTLPETKNRKSISAIAHEISAFTFGLEPWDTLYNYKTGSICFYFGSKSDR